MHHTIKIIFLATLIAISCNAGAENTYTSNYWLYAAGGLVAAGACYYTYIKNPTVVQQAGNYLKSWWVENKQKEELIEDQTDKDNSDEKSNPEDSGHFTIAFADPFSEKKQKNQLTRTVSTLRITRIDSNTVQEIVVQKNEIHPLIRQASESLLLVPSRKTEVNPLAGELMKACTDSIYEFEFDNKPIHTFFEQNPGLKKTCIYSQFAQKFMANNLAIFDRMMRAIEINDYKKETVLTRKRVKELEKTVTAIKKQKNNIENEELTAAIDKLEQQIKKLETVRKKNIKKRKLELEENINEIKDDVINQQGMLISGLIKTGEFKQFAYQQLDKSSSSSSHNKNLQLLKTIFVKKNT